MLGDVVQVSPGGDVSAEAYTDETVYAFGFQETKDFFVFSGIVCKKCRCNEEADLLAGGKIVKKCVRIILITPCLMFTGSAQLSLVKISPVLSSFDIGTNLPNSLSYVIKCIFFSII